MDRQPLSGLGNGNTPSHVVRIESTGLKNVIQVVLLNPNLYLYRQNHCLSYVIG